MRNRYNAITDEPIKLTYYFRHGGSLIDVAKWGKIEIYDGDPSNPGSQVIQTITSSGIVREEQGVYSYIVNAIPFDQGNKIYYDKLYYYIHETDPSPTTDVETFYVKQALYEGSGVFVAPTCIVYGFLYDIMGKPLRGVEVKAELVKPYTILNNTDLTISGRVATITNASGYFQLQLLQNIEIVLSIPAIGYYKEVVVPTLESINFKAL